MIYSNVWYSDTFKNLQKIDENVTTKIFGLLSIKKMREQQI